jgi:starvation-inducible DNA-binding protein
MYNTKNTLPKEIRSSMVTLLNQSLADAVDLVTHTKQAHWNVKGQNFIALHELFDQLHTDVDEYADSLAERLVSLGGSAHGTAKVVSIASRLPEYPLDIAAGGDHIKSLSTSLATFGEAVRNAIDTAADAGDADTSDLFTEISRGIDKALWFVEAHAH